MSAAVAVQHDGPVLRVTLNRPERLNAVDADTLGQLVEALRIPHTEDGVRVVIVGGAGRAFCAGADLKSTTGHGAALMDAANQAIRNIVQAPVPVIAAVNGPAVGFGVGLACAADLVYAARSAYFLLSFTNIGLTTGGGTSTLVPAAIGRARAFEMALLGERMSALEAVQAGLVARVLPDDALAAHVNAVAAKLAAGSRDALALTKRSLNEATLDGFDGMLTREHAAQVKLLGGEEFARRAAVIFDKRKARAGK